MVAVTGTVGGDVQDGDTVTLTVNGNTYTGLVASGAFSINVAGSATWPPIATPRSMPASPPPTPPATAPRRPTPSSTRRHGSCRHNHACRHHRRQHPSMRPRPAARWPSPARSAATSRTATPSPLTVNGTPTPALVASGAFSINVAGSRLAADSDTTVDASVTTTDAAGNSTTATDTQLYSVDTGSCRHDHACRHHADNTVNAAEAGGTVAVTGTVGGDVKDGDTVTLTVNGTPTPGGGERRLRIDVAGSATWPPTSDTTVDGQRHHHRRRRQQHHGDRHPDSTRVDTAACGHDHACRHHRRQHPSMRPRPAAWWRSPARSAATSRTATPSPLTVNGTPTPGWWRAAPSRSTSPAQRPGRRYRHHGRCQRHHHRRRRQQHHGDRHPDL